MRLDDDNIIAEMTATKRVGFHRYTFPKSGDANIILDLKWRDKVLDSELRIIGNNRIEGYRRSEFWAKDQIVYFAGEFSFDRLFPFFIIMNFNSASDCFFNVNQQLYICLPTKPEIKNDQTTLLSV